jgi:hypothetical protein
MMRASLALTVVVALAGSADAQPREPDLKIDAATRQQVIDASLSALRERYVFPDVATKIEAAIRERVGAHVHDR